MNDQVLDTDKEFLAALGSVLHEWQLVECELCRLFSTVMRAPDHRLTEEVFYSVQNFRDKLNMVDAALQFALWRRQALQDTWVKLNKAIGKRSSRRNKIVHGQTWSDHVGGGVMGHQLGPQRTFSTVQAAEKNPQRGFSDHHKLRATSQSFRLLARCIREFDEQVRVSLMPLL